MRVGAVSSDAKMIGSYAQIRGNVPGRFCSPRISAAPPFECPHATSVGVAGDAEVFGDREHVVGEAVPRVVDIGRVTVAVTAEVERPHVSARSHECRAIGAHTRPWNPVGCASSTGAPVAAPVVHDETDAVGVEGM